MVSLHKTTETKPTQTPSSKHLSSGLQTCTEWTLTENIENVIFSMYQVCIVFIVKACGKIKEGKLVDLLILGGGFLSPARVSGCGLGGAERSWRGMSGDRGV